MPIDQSDGTKQRRPYGVASMREPEAKNHQHAERLATFADAILDRIVHNAYRLQFEGHPCASSKLTSRGNPKPKSSQRKLSRAQARRFQNQ
jgi:hypothetical protein